MNRYCVMMDNNLGTHGNPPRPFGLCRGMKTGFEHEASLSESRTGWIIRFWWDNCPCWWVPFSPGIL